LIRATGLSCQTWEKLYLVLNLKENKQSALETFKSVYDELKSLLRNKGETMNKDANDFIAKEFIRDSPISDDELLRNLGLYMNRQLLSRILFMEKMYTEILSVHGIIMEFGTRFGQNMSFFSSFRGMHEPYNMNRKLVCFDTFEGFLEIDKGDLDYKYAVKGEFSVEPGYENHLQKVLEWHESQSPLSSIKRFEIRKGNAAIELKKYLDENPQTIIALAYFDMDLYGPTKECLELIKPYLTSGSLIGFDELNVAGWPGETIAYKSIFPLDKYAVKRWPHSSVASYIIVR